MLKAIIIDDEANAIEMLTWELSNFKNDVDIIATFTDPRKALKYLESTEIDCLFLDIEMPLMDGFKFLEQVTKRNFQVVITTAYSEFAIKAIKNEAIDYLLKPIDADDLKETIDKIKKNKLKNFDAEKFEEVLLNFNRKKISINTDGKLLFLDSDDIFYVASDGNYCTFYLKNNKKIVVTKQLKEVEQMLTAAVFFRIHNSFIINLSKIKEFLKTEAYVVLENNAKIPVSRQRKNDFLDKL